MTDHRNTSSGICQDGRGTVCVDTQRVLDSCRDRDCFENTRVYLSTAGEEIIASATNVRARTASILYAYVGVDEVPFNCGFYQVTVRYYVEVEFECSIAVGRSQTFKGLAALEKNVVLYGGEGEALSFEDIEFMSVTIFDFTVYPEEKTVISVAKEAFGYSMSLGRMVYLSLFDLVRGQYGINDLSGPIGTMSIITEVAQQSVVSTDYSTLFMLFAMITINIGLFNLLPVPALDGGHLFFMFVELVIRRKIPQKYVSWVSAAGLVLLLIFMALISANDLWKWISGIGFM